MSEEQKKFQEMASDTESEEQRRIVARSLRRGEPVLLLGATGSGKSTLLPEMADSQGARSLLIVRLAQGQGTTSTTDVTITDDPQLGDDLVFEGSFRPGSALFEDGWVADVLYDLLHGMSTRNPKRMDQERMISMLDQEIEAFVEDLFTPKDTSQVGGNSTFDHRLRRLLDDDRSHGRLNRDTLREALHAPDPYLLFDLYNSVQTKEDRAARRRDLFQQRFLKDPRVSQEALGQLRKLFSDLVKRGQFEIYRLATTAGVPFVKTPTGIRIWLTPACGMDVEANQNTVRAQLARRLLQAETETFDFLFEPGSISLLFRGRSVFDSLKRWERDALTVATVGGRDIHTVRLLDTQGLYHGQVRADDEKIRIQDLLHRYNARYLIVTRSLELGNAEKEAAALLGGLMREDLKIVVLLTHLDQCYDPRRGVRGEPLDLPGLREKKEGFEKCLRSAKPQNKGAYLAKICMTGFLRPDQKEYLLLRDEELACSAMDYAKAARVAVGQFAGYMAYDPIKLRLRSAALTEKSTVALNENGGTLAARIPEFTFSGSRTLPCAEILSSLNAAIQSSNIHYKTCQSVRSRWLQQADSHTYTPGVYDPIDTQFVTKIASLVPQYILSDSSDNGFHIHISSGCLYSEDVEAGEFETQVRKYLKKDTLGRYFSRTIASMVFQKDSENHTDSKTHINYDGRCERERLHDQLELCRTMFFPRQTVELDANQETPLLSALRDAMVHALNGFVRTRCVLVDEEA